MKRKGAGSVNVNAHSIDTLKLREKDESLLQYLVYSYVAIYPTEGTPHLVPLSCNHQMMSSVWMFSCFFLTHVSLYPCFCSFIPRAKLQPSNLNVT